MASANVTVPVRVDIRYGEFDAAGEFRESLTSKIDRTIGLGARRAVPLAATGGAGIALGLMR